MPARKLVPEHPCPTYRTKPDDVAALNHWAATGRKAVSLSLTREADVEPKEACHGSQFCCAFAPLDGS